MGAILDRRPRFFRFGRSAALVVGLSLLCTIGSIIFIQSQRDEPSQGGRGREWPDIPSDAKGAVDALRDGDVDAFKRILDSQPDLAAKEVPALGTLLHLAAANGNVRVAQMLIDRHADVNARNDRGLTPLHYASLVGKEPMVRLLIEHGADVNARSETDWTPLLFAARGSSFVDQPDADYIGVCDDLLRGGAQVDAISAMGRSAIQIATEPVARFLYAHGAKLTAMSTPTLEEENNSVDTGGNK